LAGGTRSVADDREEFRGPRAIGLE